ncbi:UMP kinase [Candidatus Bipolaricaulota bacterium]|nr:UMP kinase [Candidatus Bipolaricaulota bacterium]
MRVVLKLSGELLAGRKPPIDWEVFSFFAQEIAAARARAQLAVVPGGGNILRGARTPHPATGHLMGMLATAINGLALRRALGEVGVGSVLFSALPIAGVADPVDHWAATAALERGEVVILVGGTGLPFVTTDTAAVLRALALGAELVLKGSKVDGVYTADPKVDPKAELIPSLSHREYLERGLGVMDPAAVEIAGENGLPIVVFRADLPGAIEAAIAGRVGSRIG